MAASMATNDQNHDNSSGFGDSGFSGGGGFHLAAAVAGGGGGSW